MMIKDLDLLCSLNYIINHVSNLNINFKFNNLN
jgi:hypothetical protein